MTISLPITEVTQQLLACHVTAHLHVTGKGVITKGVFSFEESLESLKSLNFLESLENGQSLLYFPESGGSLESLESLL